MARRRFTVFSLSFLDIMSCGFGAVVLIFLIINHESQRELKIVNQDRLSEMRMLDYQVETGKKDLFELQEILEETERRLREAMAKLQVLQSDVKIKKEELDEIDQESIATEADLALLRSDVESREDEVKRMRSEREADEGGKARTFVGEGNRQYLTGLQVGGKRILIALDTSASMLDETIVNIIRRRNMDPRAQRAAPKWRRAVSTVEWLAAQLPLDADFQIYGFNAEAFAFLPETEGDWLPVIGDGELDEAVNAVGNSLPEKGTSLVNLFNKIAEMNPLPDNVFLIVDSLPTQEEKPKRAATVSGRERLSMFRSALKDLPQSVPFNIIMFPMEGDPQAAASYWSMARLTRGAFMAPTSDWP